MEKVILTYEQAKILRSKLEVAIASADEQLMHQTFFITHGEDSWEPLKFEVNADKGKVNLA